jgi:hypothetical protein
MNSTMFKHSLVIAAAFLLVASVISAETSTPLVEAQASAVDPTTETVDTTTESGSDEDLQALADMHDEEVEDAEEDSDLDGVSAARAVFYFALKFNISP